MICTICFRKRWRKYPFDKVTTECNHVYCRDCIINWIKSENWGRHRCPICRSHLRSEWRDILFTKPVMLFRPITRLFLASKRVKALLVMWESQEIENTVDEMYTLAIKIRNEKIIFNNDVCFKKAFNNRMKEFTERYDERFLELLVE